jgi:hypothetical protein
MIVIRNKPGFLIFSIEVLGTFFSVIMVPKFGSIITEFYDGWEARIFSFPYVVLLFIPNLFFIVDFLFFRRKFPLLLKARHLIYLVGMILVTFFIQGLLFIMISATGS